MLTEIKMVVTPRLSKAIQKIIFANGGKWRDYSFNEIDNINDKYLFIDKNSVILSSLASSIFKNHKFKEIDPIAFIASNGELEWLPLIGEKAEFNDNGEDWKKDIFIGYGHNKRYKFYANSTNFKYCRPIKKQISFKQFLKDNSVDWEMFLENCETNNQRFYADSSYYNNISNLKNEKCENWILYAFNFVYTLQQNIDWNTLNNKWKEICEQNTNIVWEE